MLRWYLRCVVTAREVLAPGLGGIDLDSPEAGQWTGRPAGQRVGPGAEQQEAGQEIGPRTGPAAAVVPTPAILRTYDGAVDWAGERMSTLVELVSLAADRGFDHLAAQLATALGALCHCVSRWTDWLRVTELGQAAARRTGDRLSQGRLRNDAGIAHYFLGRTDEAVDCHQAAVVLLTGLGDLGALGHPQDQAAAANLAVAYSMMGRHLAAIPMLEEALRIARRQGNGFLEASVATNLGVVLSGLDRHTEAIEYGLRCVGLLRSTGAKNMLGHALNQLGSSCLHAGRVAEAIDHFGAALDVWRGLGDQWGQAQGMCSLGKALDQAGRTAEARQLFADARAMMQESGYLAADPSESEALHALLAQSAKREQAPAAVNTL
jgi:tetratricopeptide (TPR) repeat protein